MSELLQANGNEISVGGVVLRTPGLEGEAESIPPGEEGTRGESTSLGLLDRMLVDEGFVTQQIVEIRGAQEVAEAPEALRGLANEPLIEVDVPEPAEGSAGDPSATKAE